MLKNLKTALFQTFSTWHRILSAFTALYWPSTALYWPSTTKYQPVPLYTDPVPSWINHYRLILIQCHQVPTIRAPYWPSTIMYQPVPLHTDPVPPSTNQYRSILTQYHQVSTSTNLYCCRLGITDSCTVYPWSCLICVELHLLQIYCIAVNCNVAAYLSQSIGSRKRLSVRVRCWFQPNFLYSSFWMRIAFLLFAFLLVAKDFN